MLYVYAIFEPSAAAFANITGMDDAPVRIHRTDGLGIAFSHVARGSPRPTAENVWCHEQVVEAVMRDHAMLPVRFGTVFSDAAALDELLARNRERLVAGLHRVRGRIELGVRVLRPTQTPEQPIQSPPAPIPAATSSGREYLLARQRQEQQRREAETSAADIAARLHARLAARADDATFRIGPAPRFLMTGAYLVRRESVEDFRREVLDAGAAEPALRLLCTGPWPPYHFVPELALPEVQIA